MLHTNTQAETPAADAAETIIDAMAQFFVEHGAGATEADLKQLGYTSDQIAAHGPAAAAIARGRRVRKLA